MSPTYSKIVQKKDLCLYTYIYVYTHMHTYDDDKADKAKLNNWYQSRENDILKIFVQSLQVICLELYQN